MTSLTSEYMPEGTRDMTRAGGEEFWDPCAGGEDFCDPCAGGEDFWRLTASAALRASQRLWAYYKGQSCIGGGGVGN